MLRIIITYFFLIIYPVISFSELRIDITRGNTEPIPVALVQLESKKETEKKKISSDIGKVISNNLQRSDFLRCYHKKLF